jgi:hypothetical protein
MQERKPSPKHIVLTSHPSHFGPKPISIQWGEKDPMQRGPIVVTLTNPAHRNIIGYPFWELCSLPRSGSG